MGRAGLCQGAAMEVRQARATDGEQWHLAPLLENTSLMSDAFKKKKTFKSVERGKKPHWV